MVIKINPVRAQPIRTSLEFRDHEEVTPHREFEVIKVSMEQNVDPLLCDRNTHTHTQMPTAHPHNLKLNKSKLHRAADLNVQAAAFHDSVKLQPEVYPPWL